MDIKGILSDLHKQRSRLDAAISVIEDLTESSAKKGRRAIKRYSRQLSAAGRKAIIAAQKARWAKIKKLAKR